MREYTLETYAGNTLRFWRFPSKVQALHALTMLKQVHPEAKGKLSSLVTFDGNTDLAVVTETQEF